MNLAVLRLAQFLQKSAAAEAAGFWGLLGIMEVSLHDTEELLPLNSVPPLQKLGFCARVQLDACSAMENAKPWKLRLVMRVSKKTKVLDCMLRVRCPGFVSGALFLVMIKDVTDSEWEIELMDSKSNNGKPERMISLNRHGQVGGFWS